MIGQLHSWNSFDQTTPIIGLLVPLEVAMNECAQWSGQEITRFEFIKYLRDQGVHVFNTLDEFMQEKARGGSRPTPRKSKRLMQIVDQLNVSKERVQYSTVQDRFVLVGKNGRVHEDDANLSTMHVYVSGRSKRHWSSIKRKLSFLKLLKDEGKGGHFSFDALPSVEQAATIRNIVGMSKCHTITETQKNALQTHASAIRERRRATSLQLA
ncbi:hypothetical protein JQ609_01035 [Bradyrhizobium sp. AUGA SZCCT0169]|nr:hypothetical protein [Bradyrhizobium sp. AUGA SZCCT0169]